MCPSRLQTVSVKHLLFLVYNLAFLLIDGGNENQKIFVTGGRHNLSKYVANGIVVSRFYFNPDKKPNNFYLNYNQAAMLIKGIQYILEKKNLKHLMEKQSEDQNEEAI